MNWRTEFRDFPAEDMPQIPSNWIDESWHNDACPSFKICERSDGNFLRVWVDFADVSQREVQDGKRFILYVTNSEASYIETLCETDDWEEVLVKVLANSI